MQKVTYCITRISTVSENVKTTGIGYLENGNLYTAFLSSKNKPYVRVFEIGNVCHARKDGAFSGMLSELVELECTDKNNKSAIREFEFCYQIWYKEID